ncbi:MAG: ATP-binding protein, partial [Chloroflexia bacterium]
RLGLQVAADLAGDFADGVCFVALASVTEDGLVAAAVAQGWGVRETPGRSLIDALAEYLGERQALLLLDNFEHLAGAAPVVADLLARCPALKVLVTSRAVLRLRGEREFPVPPMALPGADRPAWPEELAQYEAVALFVERALDAKPDFALTSKNAGAVGEICRRLEGLPLAIELAAARIKVLPPEGILARLESRLNLLVGGALDLPPRQRALRSAIAWSYNLLDAQEQTLFGKLAVFVSGCTLGAAAAVTGSLDALEGLSALVDKSLLRQSEAETAGEMLEGPPGLALSPRFSMLETIREFALERLEETGQGAATRREHAAYFLALAEAAEPELVGPWQIEWLGWLEADHDNLRAALRWALEVGEVETALRICGALARFWERRGYLSEGRRWLKEALSMEAAHMHSAQRAKALSAEGFMAIRQGDLGSAELPIEESLAIYEELGERAGIAQGLNRLGLLATEQADYERARSFHERSLAIYRELGDRWGVANSLHSLGLIAYYAGDLERVSAILEESLPLWRGLGDRWGIAGSLRLMANVSDDRQDFERSRSLYNECLAIYHEMGNKWGAAWTMHDLGDIAWRFEAYDEAEAQHRENLATFRELGDKTGIAMSLHRLGRIAYDRGQVEEAAALYRQSLEMARDLGNRYVIAFAIGGMASVAAARGQPQLAARLFGAGQALLETVGSNLEGVGVTRPLPAVRRLLGEAAWETEWQTGRGLPLREAIAQALE